MNITRTPIGTVDNGIDGSDYYVLLERTDGDLTPQEAIDWTLPQVYRQCSGPGSYFCDTVRAAQAQHSTNKVIVTVQHRYDV